MKRQEAAENRRHFSENVRKKELMNSSPGEELVLGRKKEVLKDAWYRRRKKKGNLHPPGRSPWHAHENAERKKGVCRSLFS